MGEGKTRLEAAFHPSQLHGPAFIQGNSVEDAGAPLVGLPPRVGRSPGGVLEAKSGRSPRNFLGTTVGDRLKARYGVAAKVREALLTYPMIAAAYTREQLTAPGPLDEFGEASRLSYFPARSPDVIYIPKPNFIERSPAGTTHGTPYDYDTHVPQLWFGAGVKPGVHPERVAVEDIAPTLAGLLGVDLPPEAKGRRLF